MGRNKRIWIPNYFYHIVCRGNRRDPLFKETVDFLTYLYILRKINDQYPFELASYCLMTNHFHLQLRSKEQPISKIMSLINKRYANYYNTKYRLPGHVFEKRYFDKLIHSDKGVLEVSRYIHLNPIEAKMVQQPEEYRWSSYPFFKGKEEFHQPYFKPAIILDNFSGSLKERQQRYCEFVESYNPEIDSVSN